MDDSITINVAFNLSDPLHNEIVKVSLEIRDKYGSDWFVDDDRYHLHFPVYLFSAPGKNEGKVIDETDRFFKSCKRYKVRSDGIFCNNSGLIMIKFLFDKEVYLLHEKAVEIFNPLREGFLRIKYRDPLYLSKFSEQDRKYIKEYGSQFVFENFAPHITISRIKEQKYVDEIVKTYNEMFLNKEAELDRLQVHKAIFSEDKKDDRTVLIYDKEIEQK